jgi:hypothetical protein
VSSPPSAEHRFARRAIVAAWLVVAFGSIGFFLASIAASIYFGPRVRPRATPVPRDDRLAHVRCNDELGALFRELHAATFEVQAALGPDYAIAVGRRWQQFSQDWTVRWRELGERCRFDELLDTGLGPGVDGTARAFHELGDVQRIYSGMIRTMVERHAMRIADLREALAKAHRQLERAVRPGAAPAPSGQRLQHVDEPSGATREARGLRGAPGPSTL